MPTEPALPSEPVFALVGDCQASKIARVARARGVPFIGGPVGNGRTLQWDFFDIDGTAFVPREAGPQPARIADLFRAGLPILSTVGTSIHRLAALLYRDYYAAGRHDASVLSDAVLRRVLADAWPGPLKFYRAADEAGCDVHVTYSSQRFPRRWEPHGRRLEAVYLDLLRQYGMSVVDVRSRTTDADGRLRPEFFLTSRPSDRTHANEAWAEIVLDEFLASRGLQDAPVTLAR